MTPIESKTIVRPVLCGRSVIYSSANEVNAGNILDVLSNALPTHNANSTQETYLYNYYCGLQPVLERTKEYNDYICNRIVVNRANEIVSFKVGYLMGEPIQYISRGEEEENINKIRTLNDYMFVEDKEAKDKELADWFSICGTSYRLILPAKNIASKESPFRIYALDPRSTFIVYNNGVEKKPLVAVMYVKNEKDELIYSCYTDKEHILVKDAAEVISVEPHILGDVPVIEYPANKQRIGEFEIVIDLLDAINTVESNRVDGVEQFVQSLLMFKGVDVEDESLKKIRQLGGVCVPPDGDVKYLAQELDQTQTQVLIDDMYQIVLTICGMPNRNGGSSTSDTGSAVLLRDGWSAAETKARNTESIFKSSEKRALKIILRIMRALRGIDLNLSDIEIRFTRRNYENIQAKAQVLLQMLSTDKIHPLLAFEHSGMFSDANLAYKMSEQHYEEELKKQEAELNEKDEDDE